MTPRALIIAGVSRSGTTLLWSLCTGHPEIRITAEFGNYLFLDRPLGEYAAGIARRVWMTRGRRRIAPPGQQATDSKIGRLRTGALNAGSNLAFATTHLMRLARFGMGAVTLPEIIAASPTKGPDTRIVGDKFPRYIARMDELARQPALLRLVIYRDGRDVTSSYLRKVRGDWRGQRWVHDADTAGKIARKWVQAIDTMERNADRLFLIRYENLVTNPQPELTRLGEWLGVDPAGFEANAVFRSSIGNYHRGLRSGELDDVLREAGPTLERLGYLHDERVVG